MLKVKLKKSEPKETDFLYKFAMECLGRTVEFGLSQKEFSTLKEKGTHYFQSFRKKVTKRPSLKIHTSKKSSGREKEAVAS